MTSQGFSTDIGKPFRLPMRVAIQVAWTSIKVRLARSVVTVSSVVLAVAFLLTVAGEAVVTRAVHAGWWANTTSQRDARTVRELAERPRSERALLARLAEDRGFRAWATGLGVEIPACDPAVAADCLAMLGWIDGLKATQVYLLTRTDEPLPWLLSLDTPGRVVALFTIAERFKGQLLPLERARIERLAAAAGTLRQALASGQRAEDLRLTQVATAGGITAVMTVLIDGPVSQDASKVGLPLAQVLPGVDRAALAEQLKKDRTRAAAAAAFSAAKPPKGLDLRTTVRGGEQTPAIAKVRTSVAEAAGDLGILATDLDRRSNLEQTAATLTGIGFDPAAGTGRTIALVGLSLLVCVVGIVNTMMMAVTERFREIATMKCLGAPDGFILRTFLVESVFLGAVGSLFGLLLGGLLVLGQGGFRFGGALWAAFPTGDLALTALAAVSTGLVLAVVGALIPAITAARMHPIEAMRVEQ